MTVVSQFRSLSGAADLDVTGDGTLTFVVGAGAGMAPSSLVWVDRQGREEELSAPPRAYLHPRVSPDGTRIAVAVDGDIWIWNVVRQTLNQLTSTPPVALLRCGHGTEVVCSSSRLVGTRVYSVRLRTAPPLSKDWVRGCRLASRLMASRFSSRPQEGAT